MLSSRYFKGSCKVFWFWDKKWAFNIYPKPYFEYWKFHKEFCTCEHDIICRPCTVAKTYNKEQYKVFENCLNLNYLCEIKGKLHGSMFFFVRKEVTLYLQNNWRTFSFWTYMFFYRKQSFNKFEKRVRRVEKVKKKEEIITNMPTVLVFKNVVQKNPWNVDYLLERGFKEKCGVFLITGFFCNCRFIPKPEGRVGKW